MTARRVKRSMGATTTNTPLISPSSKDHFLSAEEMESIHKKKDKVKSVYIESLGGSVYTRPVSAESVVSFLEVFDSRDTMTQKELINVLAKFASDTLCNSDGSDYVSVDGAKKYSVETLQELCLGVTVGSGNKKSRKGKGSRR